MVFIYCKEILILQYKCAIERQNSGMKEGYMKYSINMYEK
jgi:hypothetical protein